MSCVKIDFLISIHAPREGSDDELVIEDAVVLISIHAPREGSDPDKPAVWPGPVYFNPRSP